LAAGANVNAPIKGSAYDGQTALMLAAERGWVGLVRHLLKAGADVNQVSSSGDTALSRVSLCDSPPRKKRPVSRTAADPEGVVRELLSAGAWPDADALESAALFGRLGVAQLLLAAGADPMAPVGAARRRFRLRWTITSRSWSRCSSAPGPTRAARTRR